MIQGADGNFYGTTLNGGAQLSGSVFRMYPGGGYPTLHSFTNGTDRVPGEFIVRAAEDGIGGPARTCDCSSAAALENSKAASRRSMRGSVSNHRLSAQASSLKLHNVLVAKELEQKTNNLKCKASAIPPPL